MLGVAFIGYQAEQRTYSSSGIIHVKSSVGSVLPALASATPRSPESFIDAQMVLLQGQRVEDMAVELVMQSAAWKRAGRVYATADMDDFQKCLTISREGEIIRVTFTDHDPGAASEAVHAIMDAYSKLYLESENRNNLAERNQVAALRDRYLAQLRSFDAEVSAITGNLGIEAVESRYQALILYANNSEMSWRQTRDRLEQWEVLHPAAAAAVATGPAEDASVATLRAQDALYRREFDDARASVTDAGQVIAKVRQVQHDIESTRTYLEAARKRLEQMDIDSGGSGRIEIVSSGDRPVSHDNRVLVAGQSAFVFALGWALLFGVLWVRQEPRVGPPAAIVASEPA